jgi:hypothetical protein
LHLVLQTFDHLRERRRADGGIGGVIGPAGWLSLRSRTRGLRFACPGPVRPAACPAGPFHVVLRIGRGVADPIGSFQPVLKWNAKRCPDGAKGATMALSAAAGLIISSSSIPPETTIATRPSGQNDRPAGRGGRALTEAYGD